MDIISILPDDVLLYIFDYDSDITQIGEPIRKGFISHDDRRLTEEETAAFSSVTTHQTECAITNALRTSQVCQRWRRLLFAWPSLWGRLLDLNTLLRMHQRRHRLRLAWSSIKGLLDMEARSKDELGEEILRRAGNSTYLTVKGMDIPYGSPACNLAFRIISEHWARLEWVDIRIKIDEELSREQAAFWRAITSPAPNLRHFSVTFSTPVANPQPLTTNAPALRELQACPSLLLNLSSQWSSQLTYLSINGLGRTERLFTLPTFLNMLSCMTCVETLRLAHTNIGEGDYTKHGLVRLLTLRKLDLEDEFNTCFSVLHHLNLSSKCALAIRANLQHNVPYRIYSAFANTLKMHLEQHICNDRLVVDLQPGYFSFVDAYPDCYPAPTVDIYVNWDLQRHDVQALSFLRFLSHGKFEHVRSLWLHVSREYRSQSMFMSIFDDFLHVLDSLKVLKTNVHGFYVFVDSSRVFVPDDTIPVPLPELQRIRIIPDRSFTGLDGIIRSFTDLHFDRQRRGKPIEYLDLRDYEADFTCLLRKKGLKLILSDAQYRRGGKPLVHACLNDDPKVLFDMRDTFFSSSLQKMPLQSSFIRPPAPPASCQYDIDEVLRDGPNDTERFHTFRARAAELNGKSCRVSSQ